MGIEKHPAFKNPLEAEMQFYESGYLMFLWLIPLVLLIGGWGNADRNKRLSRWGDKDFLERRLMPGYSRPTRKVAAGLLMGVFFLATLALARPQWGEEKKKIERKGVDLVFLFDTSLSMLAEDIKPSRLAKSKLEIKNLVRRLKGDRLGMVAFSGSSFLQCPLTLDYSAFLLFVDALKPGYIPNPGTSLSQAIRLGIRAFPEESKKYRAILVFSDGEDHEGGMEEALQEAKKSGVRVYAVGVGTPEGDPIPLHSGTDQKITGYKKDREGVVVITRLNAPLLTQIAKETGGLYLAATAGEKEIDIILKHLETLGERQLKERLIAEREDHFQLFLLLAFLLLIGETVAGKRRAGSANLSTALLPLLALFLLSGFIDTPHSLVEKGNRLAKDKKYQSAVENYRKAQVAQPNEPIIRYNLGTSLHQLYEYAEAEKELEQALSQAKDAGTKAKILYNYGNTQYRLGNFEKAIESYKKVLELNPKDEDAKYNLEFLQKKKSQFEQKNKQRQNQQKQKPQPQPQTHQNQEQQQDQQQSSQDNQKQQQKDAESGGGQAEQQKEQKEKEGEDKKGGPGGQQKQEKKENEEREGKQGQEPEQQQQNQDQDEPRPSQSQEEESQAGQEAGQEEHQGPGPQLQGQMSKEDALRILEVLKEGEKELQDLRRPPVHSDSREVLKDW